jgi:hypothetical protein
LTALRIRGKPRRDSASVRQDTKLILELLTEQQLIG